MAKPKEISFGFECDNAKLWQLDIPHEELPIEVLEDNLDIAYLDTEGTDDWNLTPRELITHLEMYPSHSKKIKNVQMEYPIDLYFFNGSWKILDGVHRYCRAILEGKKTIQLFFNLDVGCSTNY